MPWLVDTGETAAARNVPFARMAVNREQELPAAMAAAGLHLDDVSPTGAPGAAQHLARLIRRSRTLEVMLSGDDFAAELAERYGWINRALPVQAHGEFVSSLAHRIARFPAAGRAVVKDRVNAIALAPPEEFRRASNLYFEGLRDPEEQGRIGAAIKRSF